MNKLRYSMVVALACFIQPGWILACGMSTHIEVAHRAHFFFDSSPVPDFEEVLEAHPEALQAGAPFPDWGYSFDAYSDAAEAAHWDPWLKVAANYVLETYPTPWDRDTQKLVVFLLGAASHSVADITFHGLGVDEGFINVLAAQDFHGDWSTAHSVADTGGDMVLAYTSAQAYVNQRWYIPIDDLVAIYHEAGHPEVNASALKAGMLLLYAGTQAEVLFGQLLFAPFARESPFLVEHLSDHPVGGLQEMSASSTAKWNEILEWMTEGVEEADGTWATPPLSPARMRLYAQALSLLRAHRLTIHETRQGRGLELSLQKAPTGRAPAVLPSPFASIERALMAGSTGRISTAPTSGGSLETMLELTARDALEALASSALRYSHAGLGMASGDFNGDGQGDLAVGTPGEGEVGLPGTGGVSVLLGPLTASSPLSLPLEADWQLKFDEPGARCGNALTVVDFNADGRDDLAVGCPTAGGLDRSLEGRVDVYLGRTNGTMGPAPDISIGGETYERIGEVLASGDVNGDARADLLLGAPQAPEGGTQRGWVGVFYASSARHSGQKLTVEEADLGASGEADYDNFGAALAHVALPPASWLLVGAPGVDSASGNNVGRLYGLELSSEGLIEHFALTGDEEGDQTGHAFAVGRPLLDGSLVLALSQPTRDEGGGIHSGVVTLTHLSNLSGNYHVSGLSEEAVLLGAARGSRFGWTLAFGDLDADGRDDLLISAPWREGPSGREAGNVCVFFGGELPSGLPGQGETSASAVLEGAWEVGRAGTSLTLADFDGAPGLEAVIAAPFASAETPEGGSLLLWP